MRAVHLRSLHCSSQDSHCLQCNSYDTDSRWGDSQSSTQSSQVAETSAKQSLNDITCPCEFVDVEPRKNIGVEKIQTDGNKKHGDPPRSDVSVNTEVIHESRLQDASSQAEFEDSKTLMHMSKSNQTSTPRIKPNMVSVATEPVTFDYSGLCCRAKESFSRSLERKSLSYQDGNSGHGNHSVILGHYSSDPFLFDNSKLHAHQCGSSKNSTGGFFHAGDSSHFLDKYYPDPDHEECSRSAWLHNYNLVNANPVSAVGMETTTNLAAQRKETKECGDEYLPPIDILVSNTGASNVNQMQNVNSPIVSATNGITVNNATMTVHTINLSDKMKSATKLGQLSTSLNGPPMCSVSVGNDTPSVERGLVRPERHADMSSLSSARTKHVTAPVTQGNTKRGSSKSPTENKKPVKQGALPASRDLHQCPTGRHPDVKVDKPCICIMVKRMVLAQSKPVLYSWHSQLNKNLTSQTKSLITGENSDAKCVTAGPSTTKTHVPNLPNFQLARPTRMVRGGQGTVAWVNHVGTGQFYALKFKQREGRSDSTWEIERREAKLLRFARHEFIVRLFHIYETEETLFMALEWLDGGCLWNHIARLGTMPECYAIYYGSCILAALRYLHTKCIVYRDMKAENIVLDHRGRPKLIDFGMAKRFSKPMRNQDDHDVTLDDSLHDSEDFDQPPTRYYFAAYLAPEIYDQSEATNQFIDSWGLGYILVEMILGYGIFLPMPWEKDPGQHLSENWKLTLPSDASSKMSVVCEDFLFKMLLRRPEERLTLEQASKHGLFARVPWSNLIHIRGPDLSKCPPKGSNQTQSGVANNGRRWMTKYDAFAQVPDMAFAREFLGPLSTSNVIFANQLTGQAQRRNKTVRVPTTRNTAQTGYDARSAVQDLDKSRSTAVSSRPRNVNVGGAVEIRTITVNNMETKKDGSKISRTNRNAGFSAN
ncbi:unnamed protein product [Echinostoma caproni]|uniref:non-specific serine/threonine protein kinase n=1 Tax=Echinostoma caproni TaxID=27848 RepID=A0A183A8A5_9TREM|nr:unnamed protein product [Echinostoma caproni]